MRQIDDGHWLATKKLCACAKYLLVNGCDLNE